MTEVDSRLLHSDALLDAFEWASGDAEQGITMQDRDASSVRRGVLRAELMRRLAVADKQEGRA